MGDIHLLGSADIGESDLAALLVVVVVVVDRTVGMGLGVLDLVRYRDPHTSSSGGSS